MDPATGGPCQGIRNSVEAMKAHGICNEVVSLDLPGSPFLGKDDFKITPLGSRRNPWAYSKKLLPWLEENLNDFDAVIVHGLWLYPSRAVQKAMTGNHRNRPPWFVMPHGMLDPYFQNAPGRKLKAIRNRIYWKFIEQKVIEEADGLLFTCCEEQLLARETFSPYQPKNTINVGYGIQAPPKLQADMEAAFLEKSGLKSGDPYFLFLSRIHPKKGIDLLLDAYAKLVRTEKQPDAIPKLVIAGPGLDTDFGKELLSRVDNNPDIKNKVSFPGMLSGKAKWGAFYHASAFVLPSHQENFGIAVAEALACSTPVLISDKVNIWREIEQTKSGIVKPDTAGGTFDLLSSWMALGHEEKTGKETAAFATYKAHFEINTVIEKLIRVLSGTFVSDES